MTAAERARSVLKLERRAADFPEGKKELDVARVLLSRGVEVSTVRERRGRG